MANRKAKKTAAAATSNPEAAAEERSQESTTKSKQAGRPRKKVARKTRAKVARRGRTPKAAQSRTGGNARAAKSAPRRGRPAGRTRYTDQQRQEILSTAQKESLTAKQVQKRFGVSMVTYYSWRKKTAGGRGRRKRAVAAGAAVGRALAGTMNVADMIRHELRTHIQKLLPEILRSEIGAAVTGSTKAGKGRG